MCHTQPSSHVEIIVQRSSWSASGPPQWRDARALPVALDGVVVHAVEGRDRAQLPEPRRAAAPAPTRPPRGRRARAGAGGHRAPSERARPSCGRVTALTVAPSRTSAPSERACSSSSLVECRRGRRGSCAPAGAAVDWSRKSRVQRLVSASPHRKRPPTLRMDGPPRAWARRRRARGWGASSGWWTRRRGGAGTSRFSSTSTRRPGSWRRTSDASERAGRARRRGLPRRRPPSRAHRRACRVAAEAPHAPGRVQSVFESELSLRSSVRTQSVFESELSLRSSVRTQSVFESELSLRSSVRTQSVFESELSLRSSVRTQSVFESELSLRSSVRTQSVFESELSLRSSVRTQSVFESELSLRSSVRTQSVFESELSLRSSVRTQSYVQ